MRAIWRNIGANQYDGRPDHPSLSDANARGLAEYVNRLPPSLKLSYDPSETARAQRDEKQGLLWKTAAAGHIAGNQRKRPEWELAEI
ncbi:hypothetical protein QBC41DRAFT_299867 [Cercophora samala]|uniref:Uncharacterized protein n=1 Tax=Cercophora samala TaxID=330535 RepID=A0AA40DCY3_9PEZI|nr:hypothetical protein QBC41DRAFT_299867 [Cercophora samala]